jgi:drug/metabolite transporter (DMT)-like permease
MPTPNNTSVSPRNLLAIVLAFAVIYLVWGTTYLGIAYSLQSIPPFISGAIRFLVAGTAMFIWLSLRHGHPFADVPWRTAVFVGVLNSGIGNGLVIYAQQGVPSGIAALVIGSIPGIVLLLDALFFTRRLPAVIPLIGMAIALAGVGLMANDMGNLTDRARPLYVFALLFAAAGWALGTLLQKGAVRPATVLGFTCVQMLVGGVFQGGLSVLDGEWQAFRFVDVTMTSWLAVVYLVVLGSILAFNCYLWLLTQVSAAAVTTYALINPVIAMCLGALLLDERITPLAVAAGALVLGGVALILFEGFWKRRIAQNALG